MAVKSGASADSRSGPTIGIVPVVEEDLKGKSLPAAGALPADVAARLLRLAKLESFGGKAGQVLLAADAGGDGRGARAGAPEAWVLAGMGAAAAVDHEGLRMSLGSVARRLNDGWRAGRGAILYLDRGAAPWRRAGDGAAGADAAAGIDLTEAAQAAAEGWVLGGYQHLEFQTQKKPVSLPDLELRLVGSGAAPAAKRLEEAVRRGELIADGVVLARDLANAPANELDPARLAERARTLAAECGLGCRILDEAAIAKEKMGGLLGVGRGSDAPPRFIELTHAPKRPAGGKAPLVFIGKAITFDTGGVCLKPAKGMEEMKADMAGGAAVLAALTVIRRLGLDVPVVGLIPSAENMMSGRAMRPGDVLRSRAGLTIEVVNTDAEGRLILADAIDYSRKLAPRLVVDLATLTGACVVALGDLYSGLFTNAAAAGRKVRAAARRAGERVWELPVDKEHLESLSSDIADIKNSGARNAGASAAAAFLGRFAEGLPWVHLDIAGTAWAAKARGYLCKGATGAGVRTLVALALEAAAGSEGDA